jgi:hypothetical protein
MRRLEKKLFAAILMTVNTITGWAQSPLKPVDVPEPGADFLDPGADPKNILFRPFFQHMASDQRQFWTSPTRLKKPESLQTFLPFVGFTAALVAGDSWFASQVPASASQLKRSKGISNYAVYSLIGSAAGAYAFGHVTHNDHMSETGFLAGEAALNGTLVAYAFKEATRRERPYQGNGHGEFLQGGSSLPSEHAAIAWSVASVVAHEYPGPLTKFAAYGLASAVSLTRVTGKQHFPSDVLVGSALGWYFGRRVYRAHHDPELGGEGWGDLLETRSDAPRSPRNMGSPYVPLDSWIYPALERLAALGFVQSAYLGIRPWTRMECARQLDDAAERMLDAGADESAEPRKLYDALAEELAEETARFDGAPNRSANIDSIYWRTTGISSTPLRDGYHFGQTLTNDFGRPYGVGVNAVAGFTSHVLAGPLAIQMQGEFQHAPAVPSDSANVLQATSAIDVTQPLANGTAQINCFRLLASTVSLTVNNLQLSFGQQNLWLGPGESGPFLASDNAEPMTIIRIDSVAPYEVPFFSRFLGPVRSQFFLGRLSGQRWEYSPNQNGPNLASEPYVHGTQLSFHPTANLELGMGFTAQFGGTGNPFTWGNFLRTFYSHKVGIANNPGKRLSEFNFSYRLPGLRNWAQVYVDSMVIDEYSPIGSNRPAINPGIYFPRLPKLPKMDLRLEGVTTDLNVPGHFGPGAFYWDDRYRSGYTNNGNLIGSWVGRRGRGEQGWLTYRFSPRTDIQLGYRHNNVDKAFLAGGEQRDLTVRADLTLANELTLSGFLQQENWNFPVLSMAAKSNVAASLQLTWWPRRKAGTSAARK